MGLDLVVDFCPEPDNVIIFVGKYFLQQKVKAIEKEKHIGSYKVITTKH